MVNENSSDDDLPGLTSIGTCGLHTIHGAFQHGAKIWSVRKVLQATWKILHQLYLRRADYEKVTNPTIFPLQFCQHRRMENENVVKRGESIWDNFVKLIKYWKTLPRSKQPDKENKSYFTLQEAVENRLMKAKFKFFEMVARNFNSFLVVCQTDHPMVLFLCNDLAFLLMLFIKKFVLEDATGLIKFSKIDPQSNVIQKQTCDLGIGFGVRSVVVEGSAEASISDIKLLAFQNECKSFHSCKAQ